jgi:hypothetical protein
MTAPSRTALEQAELLLELVQSFLAGQIWTIEQRKDARILVGLLFDHSLVADLSTLERKLRDDSDADHVRTV